MTSAGDTVEAEPLTKTENLAAFLATVRLLDGAGGEPGYARITGEDEAGVDITLSLSVFAARRVIARNPQSLQDAKGFMALPRPEGT